MSECIQFEVLVTVYSTVLVVVGLNRTFGTWSKIPGETSKDKTIAQVVKKKPLTFCRFMLVFVLLLGLDRAHFDYNIYS